jgi:uroporphyrinogen decarboxylase
MNSFKPDYKNIVDAAKNTEPKRIPLYDHGISHKIIEKITGQDLEKYFSGEEKDLDKFFSVYNRFFLDYGYDTVTFEACITPFLPHGGALAHPRPGYIDCWEKFNSYPWDEVKDIYIKNTKDYFSALGRNMPDNMKAIGGVGNGVFEVVQDLTGYENLCILGFEEPELYALIFKRVGEVEYSIWEWFLKEYGETFCVCRFGDDLGFKSNCLISVEDINNHIIPQYEKIISLIHRYGKPFLLHSCGNIFSVMDNLIGAAKIDSKHSNEDQIADFSLWVEKYGDRIGNFGGVDTDHICRTENNKLEKLVTKLYESFSKGHGGIAIGSGNSIPDYADPEKYLLMLNTVRKLRGDF